jgi:hypothetical protein
MKRLVACLLLASAALCLIACGQSSEDSTVTGREASRSHPEGEKSIEEFGAEASGSQRKAILAAEQAYLKALSASDFERSCALLANQVHESLQQFAARAGEGDGCTAILPKLLSSAAPGTARSQAGGEVSKVRLEGDRAFVIFRAPGAKLYVFTMVREGGEWKASEVAASILVPALDFGT